jgi:hypothetical protein
MLGVGVRWTVVRSGAFITPTFDVAPSDRDRFEDLHVRRAFDDVLEMELLPCGELVVTTVQARRLLALGPETKRWLHRCGEFRLGGGPRPGELKEESRIWQMRPALTGRLPNVFPSLCQVRGSLAGQH